MLSKKAAARYLFAFPLLLTLWQTGHAEDDNPRATLTQAILELQRDLLLTRAQLLPEEHSGLAIYLNVDTALPLNKGDRLNISVDGQPVVETTLDTQQLEQLMAGGIQRLYIAPLSSGKHSIKTSYRNGSKRNTKTLNIEKSSGRDNLTIILTKIQHQHAPEIFFGYETIVSGK